MEDTGVFTKTKILRYTLLPGVFPRIGNLFFSRTINFAYLIALIYNALRILPDSHPFLQFHMIGKYGVYQVIKEASNNISVCYKNIDQLIVFFAVLFGIILFILQSVIFLIGIFVSPALASTPITEYSSFFSTPAPETDIAFRLLDMVFGPPGIFNTGGPTLPFHAPLQAMFSFYSIGLLFVGTIILTYFIVAIVAESAQSGTPFGKRFNHAWVPVRFILFFAMLVPISSGFNGAQLIALYAAKWGSGLATNSLIRFENRLTNTALGERESLVSRPEIPDLSYLPEYLMISKTCKWSYRLAEGRDIKAYLVHGEEESVDFTTVNYEQATTLAGASNLLIVFGEKDTAAHKAYVGNVKPLCGSMVFERSDIKQPGAVYMQETYYNIIGCLWAERPGAGSFSFAGNSCAASGMARYEREYARHYIGVAGRGAAFSAPPGGLTTDVLRSIEETVKEAVELAIQKQVEEGRWESDEELRGYGWGGGGIWYNKIAEQNGALISAVKNAPKPTHYPEVMEYTFKKKRATEEDFDFDERFNPTGVTYNRPVDLPIAITLYKVFKYWSENNPSPYNRSPVTGSPFIDAVHDLLGTAGLFEMCQNSDIHPLAQLSGVGKSLIESSVNGLTYAIATGGVGGLSDILLSGYLAQAGYAAASFYMSVAAIGLLIGFILFYVLPFMPFMYFFLAVGGWIKGLFEAIVGVPLWALAHIRIDGEGLPGDAAAGGYFLIFEIFIRPILIVFGLMAAIIICSSMVRVLNGVFYLLVGNLVGGVTESFSSCFKDPGAAPAAVGSPSVVAEGISGSVQEFFFSIIYAIFIYMICTSTFKLIDLIPNNILRWMNAQIETFNDTRNQPAEGLISYIAIGGGKLGASLQSGISTIFRS